MNNVNDIATPTVSVVIPVYNAERFVADTAASILLQNYRNLELVLVDDGSTDSTPEILSRLAAGDERVKVLTQKNQGPSAARMTGLQASTGDYIYFFDADDLMLGRAISRMVATALATGADLVVPRFVFRHPDGTASPSLAMPRPVMTGPELLREALLCRAHWRLSELISRPLALTISNVSAGMLFGEDGMWKAQLLAQARKVVEVAETAFEYIERDGSLSDPRSINDRKFADYLKFNAWIRRYIADYGLTPAVGEDALAYQVFSIVMSCIHWQRPESVPEYIAATLEYTREHPGFEALLTPHERKILQMFRGGVTKGMRRLRFKLWRQRMKAALKFR